MATIITDNYYLKLGILNILDSFTFNTDDMFFIDITNNMKGVKYNINDKYIFMCNSKMKNFTMALTKRLNRTILVINEPILNSLKTIIDIRRGGGVSQRKNLSRKEFLSNTEMYFFYCFLSGLSVKGSSVVSGVSCKSIYATRRRICNKLGIERSLDLYVLPQQLTNIMNLII